MEGYLAEGLVPLRHQIFSRYPGFVNRLLSSPSREVRGLVKIVMSDPRSTTCRNLRKLSGLTGLKEPEKYASFKIKEYLQPKVVPVGEKWRLGLLQHLLQLRSEKLSRIEDAATITAMIDSLCST